MSTRVRVNTWDGGINGDVRVIPEDATWVSSYSGTPIASWTTRYTLGMTLDRRYSLTCYICGCDTRSEVAVLHFMERRIIRNFARRWTTRMRKKGEFVHPKEVPGYASYL